MIFNIFTPVHIIGFYAIISSVVSVVFIIKTIKYRLLSDHHRMVAEQLQNNEKQTQSWLSEAQLSLENTVNKHTQEAIQKNNEQFLQLSKTQLDQWRTHTQKDFQRHELSLGSLIKPLEKTINEIKTTHNDQQEKWSKAFGSVSTHTFRNKKKF